MDIRTRVQDRILPDGSQVNPDESGLSHPVGNTGDSRWREALHEAVADRGTEVSLFYEDRQDLTVEIDAARGESACRPSFLRGLCGTVTETGDSRFCSDPTPEAAAALVGALLTPSKAPATRDGSAAEEAPESTWEGSDSCRVLGSGMGRLALEAESLLGDAVRIVERD